MRNGQNNNKRMRNRNNNNNNNNNRNDGNRRGQNPMTRVFESNGPDIKIRGTASHVAEKYVQLARDARSSNGGSPGCRRGGSSCARGSSSPTTTRGSSAAPTSGCACTGPRPASTSR